MTSFDKLHEVHSVARERGREDFAYFANHVMGVGAPDSLCAEIQRRMENGDTRPIVLDVEMPKHKYQALQNALHAWKFIIGRNRVKQFKTTQTFDWLFEQEAA